MTAEENQKVYHLKAFELNEDVIKIPSLVEKCGEHMFNLYRCKVRGINILKDTYKPENLRDFERIIYEKHKKCYPEYRMYENCVFRLSRIYIIQDKNRKYLKGDIEYDENKIYEIRYKEVQKYLEIFN